MARKILNMFLGDRTERVVGSSTELSPLTLAALARIALEVPAQEPPQNGDKPRCRAMRNMKDVKEIRTIIERWAEAARARNISAIIADRSADILMFDVPPPTQLRRIDAYKESWAPLFAWFGKSRLQQRSFVAAERRRERESSSTFA